MNNIYFGEAFTSPQWQSLCDARFSKVVLITDKHLEKLYAQSFQAHLRSLDIPTHLLVVPPGEAAKTREMKAELEDKLFALGCGRDTLILALGGGAVTDLSGFLAATFCRGVPVIYIPTTLLAMVDAAIGGKTGVNTAYGKNVIGTVTQPDAIWIDPLFLKTLPEAEYRAAFAEVIKYACIADSDFFAFLRIHVAKLKIREPALLQQVIERCIAIKLAIVKEDEYEQGKRSILNFGHTVAHAIEKALDYRIRHGEAVAIGMVEEAKLSYQQGLLSQADFTAIQRLLKSYGLPVAFPSGLAFDTLKEAFVHDKKTRKQVPRFVLLQHIGQVYEVNGQYAHSL